MDFKDLGPIWHKMGTLSPWAPDMRALSREGPGRAEGLVGHRARPARAVPCAPDPGKGRDVTPAQGSARWCRPGQVGGGDGTRCRRSGEASWK